MKQKYTDNIFPYFEVLEIDNDSTNMVFCVNCEQIKGKNWYDTDLQNDIITYNWILISNIFKKNIIHRIPTICFKFSSSFFAVENVHTF